MTDATTVTLPSRDKRLVIGNWKMNGSMASNEALLAGLLQAGERAAAAATLAVCAPYPYLAQVASRLQSSPIGWGAQDVSAHASGAYTGEVSAAMLKEFGCKWVIVGHSERRSLHQESDELVASKAQAALQAGITPVFCVGETLAQREAGQAKAVIERQLAALLAAGDALVASCVIAYEPVWAIGTGQTATPQQAQEIHAAIRAYLPASARQIPLLYGGSVKPDNAKTLFEQNDIDGGLIGGAALVAEDFYAIAMA
jgi:triosephosphate isomerase